MKKYYFLVSFVCLSFISSLYSQDVTIDYVTWNPTSPPCNLFGTAIAVPATINGASGTLSHKTSAGQPQYISSAVLLRTAAQSGGDYYGSSYHISYDFKSGYKYNIKVTSAALTGTLGTPNGPYLRLGLSNTAGSGSACSGPSSISPDLSGDPPPIQHSVISYGDKEFLFNTLSSNSSFLVLTSIPAANAGSNGILIRKVVIDEILPPPVFTLASSGTSIVCGSVSPITFTVTNVNNSPGVTSYTWNLGSSTNGWRHNGSLAGQFITTTGNTISLTPDCGKVLSAVTASTVVLGTTYSTNSSTVGITAPSLSISGTASFCSGTTQSYSVVGAPCSASITWTSSKPVWASVSPTAGTSTVLTRLASGGSITLTASVVSCGITTNLTKTVLLGAPVITNGSYSYTNSSGTSTYSLVEGELEENDVCFQSPSTGMNATVTASGATSITWTKDTGPLTFPSSVSGPTLGLTFKTSTQKATYFLNMSNGCSSYNGIYVFAAKACAGLMFDISPNPVFTSATVSAKKISSKEIDGEQAAPTIDEIKIYDLQGNLKRTYKYNKVKSATISTSGLREGVYLIEIANKEQVERQKIMIAN